MLQTEEGMEAPETGDARNEQTCEGEHARQGLQYTAPEVEEVALEETDSESEQEESDK